MSGMGTVGRQILGLIVSSACFFSANCASSQITPDRTLPNNTTVTINGSVFNITGGTQAGRNLFHSFQEFSVPTGGTASFNNGLDIQNIFSRVTGGTVSSIDGLIRANGTANLFFLNPNGIVFGRNASLNVGGSFVATTANAIQFGNLGTFSASVPDNPALLTINPTALFYNQIVKNALIQNNSQASVNGNVVGLQVPDGKSLLLVGGNVSVDGGQLNAYGGRVELGGLAASGNINLILDGNNLRLGFPENVTRASVSLTNQAFVDVSGAGRGDIAVNAQNIEILGGSLLSAGIGQGLGTPETKAGDITLNATEQVKVQQGSQIKNDVSLNATGTGGDLTITTKDLLVSDGARVGTNTFAAGKGGNLIVNASNTQLIGTSTDGSTKSGLYTFVGKGSTGDVGNLTINTQDLLVRDGAEVSTSTLGAGKAGDLTVNATGSVQVIGRSADGQLASGLFASANQGSTGDAGNLTITAKDLLVRDGAEVSASTFSSGKGGNLTINASNSVKLIGTSADGSFSSGLFAEATLNSTGDAAVGKAGNLTITTKDLLVDDGAEVSASTFGAGKGGDLTIKVQNLLVQNGARVTASTYGAGKGGNLIVNASNNVQLIGTSADGNYASGLGTPAGQGSTGDAGDLTITARDLFVQDGARVTAETFGAGKGGNLTVKALNSVQVIGKSANGYFPSLFSANAQPGSTGDAGNLTINTQDLFVRDGAQVLASTFGAGRGGNLTVNALNSTQLFGGFVFADIRSGVSGNGGDLTINTRDLLVRDGGQVGTGTFGRGKGGNLTVNASNSVKVIGGSGDNLFDPSGFLSSAQPGSTGDGGNITINTRDLLVQRGQVSTGTFGPGKGGNLIVNADHIRLIGRIVNVNTAAGGLVASAEPSSTGNAGNLTITTQDLTVSDGASVLVDSRGMSNAGIMTINANRIRLDNEASLNANTRSPNKDPNREQATINLNSPLLVLSRGSNITTNATGTDVIGGNINIDTDVLAAVQKSNISANSTDARGGRVVINTEGLFRSPDSTITATGANSQLNGTVQINTPEVDPSHGLVTLPTVTENPPKLVSSNCRAFNEYAGGNNFTITGRGGLPPSPYEPLTSDAIWSDTRLPQTTARQHQTKKHVAKIKPKPIEIIPATGWVFNDKGEVTLISSVSNAPSTPTSCPAR